MNREALAKCTYGRTCVTWNIVHFGNWFSHIFETVRTEANMFVLSCKKIQRQIPSRSWNKKIYLFGCLSLLTPFFSRNHMSYVKSGLKKHNLLKKKISSGLKIKKKYIFRVLPPLWHFWNGTNHKNILALYIKKVFIKIGWKTNSLHTKAGTPSLKKLSSFNVPAFVIGLWLY